MYYPKSQIKTNLYTKGKELYYSDTNKEYIGFYYETSSGKYYSGKSPSDKPNSLLSKVPLSPSENLVNAVNSNQNPLLIKNLSYWLGDSIKVYDPSTPAPPLPTQYYPILTQADYDLGEFQRYFLKKTNEVKYIEINKTEYNKYVSKLEVVPFQLYIPLSIPWEISGDRNKVYNTNKQTVELKQQRQQLPGFKSYFRERYDQFYK
jgi:hypothetical protein